MHRLATQPGGWMPDTEGVIFIEQSPAPLVYLTAADTDIQVLAAATGQLPLGFPEVRAVNLLQLQQHLTIDTYAEQVLSQAKAIVLRLLGGRSYWSYGLEVVKQTVEQTGAMLFVLPGDDKPDPELCSHSTVSLTSVDRLWRYFTEGGVENAVNALKFLANTACGTDYETDLPRSIPRVGRYPCPPAPLLPCPPAPDSPKAGILFYRAHYLAGNTAPIDSLCQALSDRGLEPVPLFVSSLRDGEVQAELLDWFQQKCPIEVLLNATSFSLARLEAETPNVDLWQKLNVPVLQVILSSGTQAQWLEQTRGLSPRDMAMNVALPEVDGRIITRAVSFKAIESRHPMLETDVVGYQPLDDRIQFVADLAANWVQLRQTPVSDRRIALILANYPTKDGRLANGVGLDTPQSCVEILKALQRSGYLVKNLPRFIDDLIGDDLIALLTQTVTNDPEGQTLRPVNQSLKLEEYDRFFQTLPRAVQQGTGDRWHSPIEELKQRGFLDAAMGQTGTPAFPIAGVQFGNVFVGVQPARGYDLDPSLNYHAPDLEPPHYYLAFYEWLRSHFGAQAIVHVGKHGNLEWLPGKGTALSAECYPEAVFGAMPHLYPFIVNDPGEGSQAKRRSQAVILDHLTPPLTRAELYGGLQQLEMLMDEYYEAQSLDPSRLSLIRDRILALIDQTNLDQDLALQSNKPSGNKKISADDRFAELLTRIDGYLCELKEAQIRDGLHIFGSCPTGRQLRDLIVSIARHPGKNRIGLTRAIAQDWGLAIDPLTADPAALVGKDLIAKKICVVESPDAPQPPTSGGLPNRLNSAGSGASQTIQSFPSPCQSSNEQQSLGGKVTRPSSNPFSVQSPPLVGDLGGSVKRPTSHPWRTIADVIESLELTAAELIDHLLVDNLLRSSPLPAELPATQKELHWIAKTLLPALKQTDREITNLLHGLSGGYVPSGASGAPTRGRPEVLPTGRNFYSVDIRAIPTMTAWDVGRKAAENLIEQYAQEQGEYPRTLALSIWGTSTMRTGGDDFAEALALLGVQPVWEGSGRVIDFEILPLSVLGRPRVDVTLRISGFFRDAFPNLIDLFQQAIVAVAALDEPAEQNPLASQVQQDSQNWQRTGLSAEQAIDRAQYRIFGSKPGAYGAGLQGLIDAQNWTDDSDLARAYLNWSSYAYTGKTESFAPEAFEQRLRQMQIVLHNQDNREHDLLDSDDYYQFQGGLTAAVRTLSGTNPTVYFGDHALPENPKLRRLEAEIARVYRSRVVNPKWIAGVMRHGYKGAFEMAATVDYLFAYDATARCVQDYMYQGIADTYLFDPEVQNFVQQKNPWALRDMAERLLEANQRGLWEQVDSETLEKLRSLVHETEGAIESLSER